MSIFRRLFVCASFLVLPHLTTAQESTENPMVIRDSGAAYLKSIRLRRIDTDVAYFDPSSPPPPIETQQQPKPSTERGERRFGSEVDLPFLLISAIVVMAIAYVFFRLGSGFSVAFGRDAENAKRAHNGAARGRDTLTPPRPGSLKAILRIQDRRVALIQLTQIALSTAISANGMLLQRSWTARDALRNLPENQSYFSALRNLVLASERVHFGGRDVSEEEFKAHVDEIRPLLKGPSR